jgi:PAS domain S-box-containing protein
VTDREAAGGSALAPPRAAGLEALAAENARLRQRYARANLYVREKVNELLQVMGTTPLRTEELDDETLIELDPIGIVATSFLQILDHLNTTNEKLRFAHQEIQAVFDSAGFGILVIDRSMRILAYNARLREQFFPAAADPLHGPCHAVVCGLQVPARDCPFVRIFREGSPQRVTDWVIGGRHYEVIGTPMRDPDGQVTSVVMVYADITERIAAEAALRRSEERYRDLFENAHDLIVSVRLDGSIEYVNQAWCRTLGYTREEAAALSLGALLHPECSTECRDKLRELLERGESEHMHTILRAKGGEKVVVDGDVTAVHDQGRRVALRGILRDVTEKEQLEEEMRKREKLESIGLLAGGIAHDFNNILTAILGNLNLAALHVRPGEALAARLKEAEHAALSARDLTQQLLTFSRGGQPVKKVADLGELVRQQAAFALRGSAVSCRYDIAPDLRAAEVDAGQIGQVVSNLVINAVQATRGGGRIFVGARNAEVSPRDGLPLPAGAYVLLTVRDEGCGIPAENLQRIFDPYFTTKPEGNGLGLSIVHSIVSKHGGCVRVASVSGEGSTFSVYLPATEQQAAPEAREPEPAPAGKGRVLVLDDEAIVREVATHMLRELGYEVECAPDGAEALRLYRAALDSGGRFDAVIMDLTIPGGMGGGEAIAQLRAIDPGVRAIVSSGYSNDPIMARCGDFGFCGVIAKPYKLADLAAVVREAVARPAAGAGPGQA